ncbi:PRC-barrel domain-containing protein [Methylobacterium sp. J-026]|uniref:PRC-barrel domain-containing protein n=1 Tax=Methylobacterium sp. J-026 TaxID=2836624 RepID=UPI001FB91516|nr:PRC-barrel domain-containing protein [Methylobacterium sp. J-026]MCJ2136931.1 PRC-barrel domain-containing protein [Methylobacterium sp. J-026]
MRDLIRPLTLGACAALILATPLRAVGERGADPAAATAPDAEALPAQACLDHLKVFDAQMEKDGYWLGGSGYGYGYPLGGYWAGSLGSDAGMAMGAASAMMRYANARPGYEVRILLAGADILARHGEQQPCEDVLVQIRASYDAYKTDLQGRDLRIANALGFRKQELALAQPVASRTRAFRSDDLLGSEVRNPGNVALGSVDDIVMGPEGGKIAYLVVARGGIFGLGERHVAVPWDQFKVSPNLNILVLDTSKDGMDQAPRMIEGRFTTAEPFARQTAKADAYWSAAAKIRRTD